VVAISVSIGGDLQPGRSADRTALVSGLQTVSGCNIGFNRG